MLFSLRRRVFCWRAFGVCLGVWLLAGLPLEAEAGLRVVVGAGTALAFFPGSTARIRFLLTTTRRTHRST